MTTDDSGQVAGIEAAVFGFLIFGVGTLLIVNAWSVLDAKLAVTEASREATRAYVESPPAVADARARRAASEAMAGHGRAPQRLSLRSLGATYERCALITFIATYTVPAVRIPLLGTWGEITVRSQHAERVDPYAVQAGRDSRSACG